MRAECVCGERFDSMRLLTRHAMRCRRYLNSRYAALAAKRRDSGGYSKP